MKKTLLAIGAVAIMIASFFIVLAAYDWLLFPKQPLQGLADISLSMAKEYPEGPVSKEIGRKMTSYRIPRGWSFRLLHY